MQEKPNRLCECGCGEPAPIATQTRTALGHVPGQPVRFISGHARRRTPNAYEARDCGYETPCWVWLRCTRGGYGQVNRDGRTTMAHRAEWEKVHGPQPPGTHLHHLCENPPCVNPAHLELLTPGAHQRLSKRVKLTPDDVRAIRALCDAGVSQRVIARDYGLHPTTVCNINTRKNWKDVA